MSTDTHSVRGDMTNPMVRIIKGDEVIDREMTKEEYTQWLADGKQAEERRHKSARLTGTQLKENPTWGKRKSKP